MWRSVCVAATAFAIVGGSFVYAQQRPDSAMHRGGWQPSAEDIAAFGEARIAALKAGLRLTPDQEKHWPALEKALRDRAMLRSEKVAARASADRPRDPIERLHMRADMLTQRGAALKALADAAASLYQSLDESQKHRFVMLARLGGRGMGGHHHRQHNDAADDRFDVPRGRIGPNGIMVPDAMGPAGALPPPPDGAPRPQ
jgi:hypothetical protein